MIVMVLGVSTDVILRSDEGLKSAAVKKTPFESVASVAHATAGGHLTEDERARVNQSLWQEQRHFMEKLNRRRAQRQALEVRLAFTHQCIH